jgi:hypothetical protein
MLTTDIGDLYGEEVRRRLQRVTDLKSIVFVELIGPSTSLFGIYRSDASEEYFPDAVRRNILLQTAHSRNGNNADGILDATRSIITQVATHEHINPSEITGLTPWRGGPWLWLLMGVGVALGTPAYLARRRRKKAAKAPRADGKPSIGSRVLTVLYWGICVGVWGVFGTKPRLIAALSGIGSLTSDATLNFLIVASAIIIGLCLVPGILMVGLYLLGAAIVLEILGSFFQFLVGIARVSEAGAVVAGIIGTMPLIWAGRRFKAPIGRALWRVAEPIYGIFFDWWITPIFLRRKEKKIMDDVLDRREQYESIVSTIQAECPEEVGDISISVGYKIWISSALERFITRQKGKNFTEQIRLLTLAKQYYTEYAAALEAKDKFKRVKRGDSFKEEDEEVEIRALEREKRRLALQADIEELKTKKTTPAPPPPPPRRDPVMDAIAAAMRRVDTIMALEQKRDEEKRKHPDLAPLIDREFSKIIGDAREQR